MKYQIVSKFHNKEMFTTIKNCFANTEDVLSSLDYEVYNHGKHYDYAKKKLNMIKKELCGNKDCGCVFFSQIY
jgi:hypothetical protein